MSDYAAPASPRSAALRVFGTVGATVLVLVVAAAIVRPDTVTSAIHAVMGAVMGMVG